MVSVERAVHDGGPYLQRQNGLPSATSASAVDHSHDETLNYVSFGLVLGT
jgi:hypothetical protein